jgi:ubiquinone biosynthesis protein Coq4
MLLTLQPAPLNLYQRLARKAIAYAKTSIIIPTVWHLYGARNIEKHLNDLQGLPLGTLGRGIADTLHRHKLQLIPNYENRDLKHVLLGYDMTPEDELKLKSFMLGNGDYSPRCFAFLALGLLTPELWPTLMRHFRQGRRTQPIHHWHLADYAAHDVEQLRYQIGFYEAQEGEPRP